MLYIIMLSKQWYAIGSTEALDLQPDAADKTNVSQHRGNTTMHVCWHRMTSVGARDHYVSLQVYHCSLPVCMSLYFKV